MRNRRKASPTHEVLLNEARVDKRVAVLDPDHRQAEERIAEVPERIDALAEAAKCG